MTILKGTVLGLSLGLSMLVTTPAAVHAAEELKPVVFSLDFIPLGRHAAWYAALEEGFFKEEGLDVSIIPAQGTAQVMQAIASGTAQFGFVDLPGVVLAQAGGTDIRMIAVNYQKAPYAIFSLANGGDVQEAVQLEGLSLGSGAGSITPQVIGGFMSQKGLSGKSLEIVNVAPPARASALLSGQVPAIEFFVMAKPGLEAAAKEAGTELRTFLLADNGLELYSNGIGALGSYLEGNPDVAKGFVRAALRGWQFALANPEKAAEDIMKNVDGLKHDVVLAEIGVVRDLVVTDEVKDHGLGWFSPEKMKAGVDFVVENVGVSGTPPDAGSVYLEGFLPDPAIKP
ncbi:ABC transporter substrate-binding protein [Nitratireductor pacificus]|uniref:NMT1/THI5 like domain-containing protein n=1 Tax=Nitratireductor pacificus pht-3B TaxID=391937 RepID=K2MIC3_9HYPH|nr:ABC transporter substrate-binding protein [Nitratireductor pacificus]EKF20460.1 NMT1/THI5 like domain-containing protein [Nitratireductor pacificus pht-3B]